MNSSFEIYKTMVASTAHVDQGDFDAISYFPEIFSMHDHHYGSRLYLSDDLLDDIGQINISEGLKMLILFAKSNDCRYLDLDLDGPTYDKFPIYDW